MKIVFESSTERSGRAIYRADEFSLEYEHSLDSTAHGSSNGLVRGDATRKENGKFFLIADTLAITFGNNMMELLGFDSYTNWIWR
ncbi:MAG: hypothetical protein FJ116_09400 [Deltaproteobacteria bacterium]|nr:hypothetical protein [Deltaproteobacteria bacterium]